MSLPRDEAGNVDCKALVDQLRICPTLQEQADILYMLHILKYGKLWDLPVLWVQRADVATRVSQPSDPERCCGMI